MTTEAETEHVARAICAAMGYDPDAMMDFDPTQVVDPPTMLRTPQAAWTFFENQAIKHIAAWDALWMLRFSKSSMASDGTVYLRT